MSNNCIANRTSKQNQFFLKKQKQNISPLRENFKNKINPCKFNVGVDLSRLKQVLHIWTSYLSVDS